MSENEGWELQIDAPRHHSFILGSPGNEDIWFKARGSGEVLVGLLSSLCKTCIFARNYARIACLAEPKIWKIGLCHSDDGYCSHEDEVEKKSNGDEPPEGKEDLVTNLIAPLCHPGFCADWELTDRR